MLIISNLIHNLINHIKDNHEFVLNMLLCVNINNFVIIIIFIHIKNNTQFFLIFYNKNYFMITFY